MLVGDIFAAVAAGLIQGVTEFLPVSSSGHLLLWHRFTGSTIGSEVAFDVALHLATLVALLAFFWRDLLRLASAWVRQVARGQASGEARLAWWLILGTLPAVAAGVAFSDAIIGGLREVRITAIALIGVGVLMLLVEAYARRTRNLSDLGLWDAVLIGTAQAIALIPGVSRSGITIIAGLGQGLHREAAARFAFLLAIPVTAGAGLHQAKALASVVGTGAWPLAAGFIAAAISGFWAIGFLLRFVRHSSLRPFAVYRIALGITLLLILR